MIRVQFNKWFWLCTLPGGLTLFLADSHHILLASISLALMCIFAEKSGKYIERSADPSGQQEGR